MGKRRKRLAFRVSERPLEDISKLISLEVPELEQSSICCVGHHV